MRGWAMLLSLPQTTGGFLSCVLALVLPLAYSFQPDLVLVVLGPAHGLRDPQAALLAALLRGPAGGRVLALVDEVSWAGWTCCGVGVRRNQQLTASTSAADSGIHTPACGGPGQGVAWRGSPQPGSLLHGLPRGRAGPDAAERAAGATVEDAAGGQ